MTKIELKGELSISNAEEILKMFKSASQKSNDINLDVSKLEDIDTSIIQLVYALYRAVSPDRVITVTGPFSSTVKRRLFACGILPSPDIDDVSLDKLINEKVEEAK